MVMKINGEEITAREFAWDGCHKIYLIDSEESRAELLGYGYDLYAIHELKKRFNESCGLRFISSGDLSRDYVPQGMPKSQVRITMR